MSFRNYFSPKNGRTYIVIGVCRISTEHQDIRSLEDQEALYREWCDKNLDGTYELMIISSQGSGEDLERPEYLHLLDRVEAGDTDLVIAEDLGRITRRVHGQLFCELAEDTCTRFVAINDSIDTAKDGWQQLAFFASFRHETYNRDTAMRIKRSLRNRFQQGGIVQSFPYGYVKPKPGANDAECSKDPAAEAIYKEWFERLEQGQSYAEVSDWLNVLGISTGPTCRTDRWDTSMVARVTRNPILKGVRERNKQKSVRINSSGKHKSVKAEPELLLQRSVPHLAFFDASYYDRVIRVLNRRNRRYRRAESAADDPCAGVARRDSKWPGNHLLCGACGRNVIYGGHGQKERLMCSGASKYKCWNAMSVSGPQIAQMAADTIRQLIIDLPDFDSAWRMEYDRQSEEARTINDAMLKKLNSQRTDLERQLVNLLDALAEMGQSNALKQKISATEEILAANGDHLEQLRSVRRTEIALPTADEVRAKGAATFKDLAVDSRDFTNCMKQLVSDLRVEPYRMVDGGHIEPRVTFKLSLAPLIAGTPGSLLDDIDSLEIQCDLPLMRVPQRELIREQAVRLHAEGLTWKEIGKRCHASGTAVGNALMLQKKMDEMGITDPWVRVKSAAEASEYFKRIRHPRFKFEPLAGFGET